jgi:hypothetical protein
MRMCGGVHLLLALVADELGDELERVLSEAAVWNGDLACTSHSTSYERFRWLRGTDRAAVNNCFVFAGIGALLRTEGHPLDPLSASLQLPYCAEATRIASSAVEIEALLQRGPDWTEEDRLLDDLLSALLGPDSESEEVR